MLRRRSSLDQTFSRDSKCSCDSVWYPRRGGRIHSAVRVYCIQGGKTTGLSFYSYLQQRSKSIEEPAMTVDLLLILLLHTKDDLRRHDTLVRIFEVQVGVESEGCRILEQMCGYWLVVDGISHVAAGLIYAKEGQTVEDAWVYFPAAIGDDTYNHLNNAKVSTGIKIYVFETKNNTFFHASTPHVCEFLRLHKCAILRITPYKVLQNRISSSYNKYTPIFSFAPFRI